MDKLSTLWMQLGMQPNESKIQMKCLMSDYVSNIGNLSL